MPIDNKLIDDAGKKYRQLTEWFYLCCLAIFFITIYINGTTMVDQITYFNKLIFLRIEQAVTLLVMGKIVLLDKYPRKLTIKLLLIFMLITYICYRARAYEPLFYTVFLIGAKDVDFRKILKLYLTFGIPIFIVSAWLALNDYILNLTLQRPGDNTARIALGNYSPSDAAAHIFYFMLAYALLKRFKWNIPEIVSGIALLICVYTLTATKLDEILIILILLLCAGGYKYAVKFIQRFSLKQVRWGLWIYAVINVMLPLMFNPNSRIWSIINTLSSARLFFGQVAYHDYAIPLFGQFVYQNGNGSIKPGEAYFFIDSSFVRALLMYGLVFFVVAMFYIISSIESNIKQRNYNLVIALILVLLSSAIDNHLWDMAFNIVFLGMFADVQSDNEIVGIENESNTK